jgi:ferric-dicitrate binding protein FerR (iron transport regulator)
LPREEHDAIASYARGVWRRQVKIQTRQRWAVAAVSALAAGLLLVFGWRFVVGWGRSAPAIQVASVDRIAGELLVGQADGSWRRARAGEALPAGARLRTPAGARGSLALSSDASVRLDQETRLVLHGEKRIELAHGAIYVDSGSQAGESVDRGLRGALEVWTPFAVARDIGTQFEVALEADRVMVRVREGEVVVEHHGESDSASEGVELRVDESGEVERAAYPRTAERWRWVLAVSPPFELEGQTLAAFLDWVSRETGWRIVFVDQEQQTAAEETILHGSIDGLEVTEAPLIVLRSVGLSGSVENGVLSIR